MAATCPSYIGARRLRVTRLDECGRPVYGPCNQVVSDGFVSVEFSPEVEEGEDYTQRNANGDLCVNERGKDALTWISVAIEFCRVDAELWQIMNPTWKTVTNAQGDVTGFRIGEKFSDTQGFALELWPKATGQASLCDEDAPTDAAPNGYFLLPYVLGGAPESWTLENGVATFTLNGRTKGGSLWGRGPYNITHDAAGQPSPLLQPIDSGATSGNPDHFHADIVTLAPPPAACGCQPLEALPPGAQGGQITFDPAQPNRGCFTVSGSPGRPVTITWGDGTDPVNSRVGREECHLYTATGTYTVTVADADDPAKSNEYQVEVTEVPPLPNPVVSTAATSVERAIDLQVNNHGNGTVSIDWGAGGAPEVLPGGTDTTPVVHRHQYAAYGTYDITVTATADDRATATATADLPAPAPNQPTNLRLEPGTVTNAGFTVAWNYSQGSAPAASGFEVRHREQGATEWTTDPATGAAARTHQLTGLTPGTTYEVQVRSITAQGGQSAWTASITQATNAAAMELTAPATGTAGVELNVQVNNHDQGSVTIAWGDDTADSPNPGDNSNEPHTYAAAGDYTITAVDDDDPNRSATATVTVAAAPAALTLTAPATGTVNTELTITADNDGQGEVTITWGDETAEGTNPGDGTATTAHTYTAAGDYTITATDSDDSSRTDTATITVTAAQARRR